MQTLETLIKRRGILSDFALARAIQVSQASAESLSNVLVRLGLLREAEVANLLGEGLQLEVVEGTGYPIELPPWCSLPSRFLKEFRVVPLAEAEGDLAIAVVDPTDDYPARAIALACGREILVKVGLPSQIDAALLRLFPKPVELEEPVLLEGTSETHQLGDDVERLRDMASDAPVIRFVNCLFQSAIAQGASDIHLEPDQSSLRVRFRVDGELRETDQLSKQQQPAIFSRLKILAGLNIAERRLPQDGRIDLAVAGNPIDLRVAVIPTVHGESAVIRILNRSDLRFDFSELGLAGPPVDSYKELLNRPHGILLMTGPTGSGKTTTLYTSLLHLKERRGKIITVEDPVEYKLDGIVQVHVRPKIDLTFASVLRSALRHDPDVIMIGEIRDKETAQIAIQAALTGHLVLSTLHTNSAASSITRLADMGIEEYLITAALNGAAAQRLVRRLCPACKRADPNGSQAADRLQLSILNGATIYEAVGCASCNGTGYRGRIAIFETLTMTDEVRRLVLQCSDAAAIQAAASAQGMRTLVEDGAAKIAAGVTTLDEVLQVSQEM